MFDDFFLRAVLAAIGTALMTGPVGCFVVWQRLSYFGDTIAHSALLGVAIGLLLDINISLSVFFVTILIAALLLLLQRSEKISNDSILGILAHSMLAISMVLIGFMNSLQIDLSGYLFGDILAASKQDLIFIWVCAFAIILILALIWNNLLMNSLNKDIALAEQPHSRYAEIIFTLLLASIIAVSIKLIGVLLITALLVIPACAAQKFSNSPENMAVASAAIGIFAALIGLEISYIYDTRSGASIVVTLFFIFIASRLILCCGKHFTKFFFKK